MKILFLLDDMQIVKVLLDVLERQVLVQYHIGDDLDGNNSRGLVVNARAHALVNTGADGSRLRFRHRRCRRHLALRDARVSVAVRRLLLASLRHHRQLAVERIEHERTGRDY